MKKIRIGKDFDCIWSIKTNGQSASLEGRDLTLYLVDPHRRKKQLTFTIEGNALQFQIGHALQLFMGIYSLELWENLGKVAQSIADKKKAFQLIDDSEKEEAGTDSNLTTTTLDLGTSDLSFGFTQDQLEALYAAIAKKVTNADNEGGIGIRNNYIWLANGSNLVRFEIESGDLKMKAADLLQMKVGQSKMEMDGDVIDFTTEEMTYNGEEIATKDYVDEQANPFVIDTSATSFDINITSSQKIAVITASDFDTAIANARAGKPLFLKVKCYLRGGTYIVTFPVSTCTFNNETDTSINVIGLANVASSNYKAYGSIQYAQGIGYRMYLTFATL